MVKFCPQCGSKIADGNKFCSKCGARLDERNGGGSSSAQAVGLKCPYCNEVMPNGVLTCPSCGMSLNPKANEKHTAAIVIGYICSFVFPIVGIILGIYLLTRENKDVHKHGIILICLFIILFFIRIFY